MKKRLEVELLKFGPKSLVFRVVEQDDSLRGKGTLAEIGGWRIKSYSYPEIDYRSIHVRGSDEDADDNAVFRTYDSTKGRDEAYAMFMKLVDKVNEPEPFNIDAAYKRLEELQKGEWRDPYWCACEGGEVDFRRGLTNPIRLAQYRAFPTKEAAEEASKILEQIGDVKMKEAGL